jgi:hypothetical protein
MAELKTQPTTQDVNEFLNAISDEHKRADSLTLAQTMQEITGAPPVMWGSSIIGFGNTHYRYASGREGDWFLTGFSPRKQNLTLYLAYGLDDNPLVAQLGKCTTGKGCLYIKKLTDIDMDVLRQLITQSVAFHQRTNG